jgi:histidine triad (HIT) family protein
MGSIFSKIVKREVPAHLIAETQAYLAFLDIMPVAPGHTLVIPKKEIDLVFDLEDDMYTGLFIFAKYIAKSLARAIPCQRVGMAVVGLEVPHAHIHLVPLQSIDDLNLGKIRNRSTDETLASIAAMIREQL